MKADFRTKPLEGIGTRKYLVDYQTGFSDTGMHWHDTIEIVHVEHGLLHFYLNHKWYELKEGETIFVPPQRIHYMYCDHEDTAKTVIGIAKNLICDVNVGEENILLPFETDKINDYCYFPKDEQLMKLVADLQRTPATHIESLLIQADILKLYAHIYHCWLREGLTFMDPLYDQTIHRILHTLQQNFAAPPSAYEMAKLLDVSYSHMCRLLQSGLRSSYGELLLFIRIEHAKKMLLTTSKSITEIGFDCGFTDSSYFIKRFKETVGITPKKYRENIVHPM